MTTITHNRELIQNRLPRRLPLPRNDAAFSFRHRERGTSAAIFCLEVPVTSSVPTDNRKLITHNRELIQNRLPRRLTLPRIDKTKNISVFVAKNNKPQTINTRLPLNPINQKTGNSQLRTDNRKTTDNQRFAKMKNSPKFTLTKN
ncbi:hypothetical protein SAMN05660445_00044 [Salegentibacter salarius]|nr:hypothetical protein SAMN05660445_00044 [Salegentibacter salarius]